MPWWMKYVRRNELDGSTGGGDEGGGGLNIETASDQLGEMLGFGKTEGTGNEGEHQGEQIPDPKPTPAPSPAPAAPAATPAPSAAPAATPAPAPAATPAPAPAGAPATPPRFTVEAPPATWTKAAGEAWPTLPLSVREEIARRENDMFRGLEQYKDDARGFKEVRSALGTELEQQLRTMGAAPQVFVKQMADTHMYFANQKIPAEQRLAHAKQLFASYGLDLGSLGTAAAPAADSGTPAYVDPEVKALREKVEALESQTTNAARARESSDREQRAADLKAWAEDGKHPYFYDVADEMALLIRGSGGKMDREAAYQQAIRLNPVTWAKEQEQIGKTAAEKALQEQRDKAAEAEKARRARVKTSGHQGGGTAPSGSMDETMKETLAGLRKRESK